MHARGTLELLNGKSITKKKDIKLETNKFLNFFYSSCIQDSCLRILSFNNCLRYLKKINYINYPLRFNLL